MYDKEVEEKVVEKISSRASLVAQWLRINHWLRILLQSLSSATRGRDSERPAHRNEEWPPLATNGESPSTETKTQHSNQSINQSLKKS